jgi:hypothetical protein
MRARIRWRGEKQSFIFLTAHADAEFVQTCMGIGALGYVIKPRIAIDLIPAIEQSSLGVPLFLHLFSSGRSLGNPWFALVGRRTEVCNFGQTGIF